MRSQNHPVLSQRNRPFLKLANRASVLNQSWKELSNDSYAAVHSTVSFPYLPTFSCISPLKLET